MDESKSLKRPHMSDSNSDSAKQKQQPLRPRLHPKPNIPNPRTKENATSTKTSSTAYTLRTPPPDFTMNYLRSLLLLLIMCSLVSLNTQGLRSPDCRKSAFNFVRIHKYDIIFLQETHWTTDLQDAIQREWTGDIYFNNGTANSCGLTILFNPRFNYTHTNTSQDSSGRVLAITIKIDAHYLQLVNLYAPNSDTDRRKFFSSLEPFFSSRYHIVIGGDF